MAWFEATLFYGEGYETVLQKAGLAESCWYLAGGHLTARALDILKFAYSK